MMGIERLWIAVLDMSVSASLVALGVMLVRTLLVRACAPRIFAYVLWSAVLFRLLLPVSFTSGVSLLGVLRPGPERGGLVMRYVPYEMAPVEFSAVNSVNAEARSPQVPGNLPPAAAPVAASSPRPRLMEWLSLAWALGVAVLVFYTILSYWSVLRRVRTATWLRDNIWETDRIDAPFVCGLFEPRIFVPPALSAEQLMCVEAHELTHIRRFDYGIKPLAFLVVAIHWFNPLMWFAYRLMAIDMEVSCDESAIRKLGADVKAAYSRVLLDLSMRRSGLPAGSLPAFGEGGVRARIQNVLRYRRARIEVVILAIVVTVVAMAACLANPRSEINPDLKTHRADNLLAHRTRYVGDNSKDLALMGALSWPRGAQFQELQLKTSSEPYGLTATFRIYDDYLRQIPQVQEAIWKANAYILFSVIDNVQEIRFETKNDIGSDSRTFTRNDADALFGANVRSFAKDRRSFDDFLRRADRIWEEPGVKVVPVIGWGGWVQPAPNGANWGGDPDELLDGQTRYKKILSRDVAPIVALSWPQGARRGYLNVAESHGEGSFNWGMPATFYGLKTGEEEDRDPPRNIGPAPHHISVSFNVKDEASMPDPDIENPQWKANAIILLSLITESADVTFEVIPSLEGAMPGMRIVGGPPPVKLTYTRADAEAVIGEDVRNFAADPVRFRDLLARLETIAGPPRAHVEGVTGK